MRCEAPRETLRLVYPDERRSAHRIPGQPHAKQSRSVASISYHSYHGRASYVPRDERRLDDTGAGFVHKILRAENSLDVCRVPGHHAKELEVLCQTILRERNERSPCITRSTRSLDIQN